MPLPAGGNSLPPAPPEERGSRGVAVPSPIGDDAPGTAMRAVRASAKGDNGEAASPDATLGARGDGSAPAGVGKSRLCGAMASSTWLGEGPSPGERRQPSARWKMHLPCQHAPIRALKKAFLAFFNAGSRKCDFRLPHVFNEASSLSDFDRRFWCFPRGPERREGPPGGVGGREAADEPPRMGSRRPPGGPSRLSGRSDLQLEVRQAAEKRCFSTTRYSLTSALPRRPRSSLSLCSRRCISFRSSSR